MTQPEKPESGIETDSSASRPPVADPAEGFDKALVSAVRSRRNPRRRADGWTPARIRTFLRQLAACGVASDAARAAGMSVQSAYNLRNRAGMRAFGLAWDAALRLARAPLADAAMSRALDGWTERIIRDGKVWGERNRYDNRLTMRMLERLDRLAAAGDEGNRIARIVAEEFDAFVELVCADGDVAAFLSPRLEADREYVPGRELRLLARLAACGRDGAGRAAGTADACASGSHDGASAPGG